jgi:hypothetical protein
MKQTNETTLGVVYLVVRGLTTSIVAHCVENTFFFFVFLAWVYFLIREKTSLLVG